MTRGEELEQWRTDRNVAPLGLSQLMWGSQHLISTSGPTMCVIGHADQYIGGVVGIEGLINSAKDGSLVLHMDDEAFDRLITACDVYIDDLKDLYRQAMALADKPLGFSEDHLDSGAQLAKIFQKKAGAAQDSAAATFMSHIERVEEMKTLFLASRSSYQQMEANNAHGFKLDDGH